MDSDLLVFFGLLGIGFGIFVFALLVRLWGVLDIIREICRIIQRTVKEKYPNLE